MLQASFGFINKYRAVRGCVETPQETLESLMLSPLTTYMGGGWFMLFSEIEEGQTSDWSAT